MYFLNIYIIQYILFLLIEAIYCNYQVGPDPWDLEVNNNLNQIQSQLDIPHDLKAIPEKKMNIRHGAVAGDWFYKRMLAIILKSGQVKKKEDGTVFVSLEMYFEKERWLLLEDYTAIDFAITEDMIRRSLGYIEEAIYKPTIIETVAVAWTEYIQLYLVEYKMYITWAFGILAVLTMAIWFWKHMSHTHIYIMLFISLYLYEAFTSYKVAEKEDLQRFLSAVNNCKWYFWSSNCEVPPPDPLIFIKHMNPLKISIRMLTTVIMEPMICINETVTILIHGITDGLWFPFDKIMYSILNLGFNIIFIFFLIMIVFNYILNIPFKFNYLGLFNIELKQRDRTFNKDGIETSRIGNGHGFREDTFNKLLDVCSQALSTAKATHNTQNDTNSSNKMLALSDLTRTCRLRRSASTGRLPNAHDNFDQLQIGNSQMLNKKAQKLFKKAKVNGDGDGF